MTALLLHSLPSSATIVRVHVSGDFYTSDYFKAWLNVARQRPAVTFYWYTKAIRFWVDHLEEVGNGHSPGTIPNIVPTASLGGHDDAMIEAHGLRSAIVVFDEQEAQALGLAIDHDDSHAMWHGPSFALLLHGPQPAGSPAAQAIAALRKAGDFGYGARADEIRRERFTSLPLVA
jgi:hypothetical protein